MSLRVETCFTIGCDECGQLYGTEDGAIHFASEQAATDSVSGDTDWAITAGRVVCERCLLVSSCALMGHTWSPWRVRTPVIEPATVTRWCRACGAFDIALRGDTSNDSENDTPDEGPDDGLEAVH